MTELTVACLADLHLDSECVDAVLATVPETYDQLAIEAADTLGSEPDLCVVLGDVLQETAPETDAEILERVGSVLDSLPVPGRVIPGNHDVVHCSPAEFATHLGAHVADDAGWWVNPDRELVFLNSAAPRLADSRGELTDPQQALLRERLPAMSNPLVFCHHPLHPFDLSSNQWFRSYPEEAFCGRRRPVMDSLTGGAPSAVVTGHLHEHHISSRQGTAHIVVDAYNKTAGHGQNGAHVVLKRHLDGRITGYHVTGDERRTNL
jgi:3',5'-cyclic AMP phosphodiesterase CpdA